MPPVKYALILLPVCWPSLSFEDFAQFQLLPRACKHISALISSQIFVSFGHKKHRSGGTLEDYWVRTAFGRLLGLAARGVAACW